ncbi:hypothetical protein NUSPORA_02433 [Nucleospora cyclopteri]
MKLKLHKFCIFYTYMNIKYCVVFLIKASQILNKSDENDSDNDDPNLIVNNVSIIRNEDNLFLFQLEHVTLQENSLRQTLDQLNNIFLEIIEKDDSSIYKHELFDIAKILISDKMCIYKYVDSKFDFGVQVTPILNLSSINADEINIDFSQFDIAFFMGFDISKLTTLQYNTLNPHITNLINSYIQYIDPIKETITSDYTHLKTSINNEVILLAKHKKRFYEYESKYKLFLKNFFNESINNTVRFNLYNKEQEFLRNYIPFFYNFNQLKIKIEFLHSKLELYINMSKSFNKLTNFIYQKILLEKEYFNNLTDQEKRSADLIYRLIEKSKMDQTLKVQNLKKHHDEINRKYLEHIINVNDAETKFHNAEKNFLKAQENLNDICIQIDKYRSIEDDTEKFKNIKYTQRFEDCKKKYFELLKLKNLAINEYEKTVSSFFHFVIFEKNKTEKCYYIELYFLQLIKKKINSMNFLIQYFEKNISFSINLIEFKLEKTAKISNTSQSIYSKTQYEFLKLIFQENKLLNQIIENDLKTIQTIKLMKNRIEEVDLGILEKTRKYTENFKVKEMYFTLKFL